MARVVCPHCESVATIQSTRRISTLTKEYHCRCAGNIECGHTFVCRMEIAYTVRPSGTPNPRIQLPFSDRIRQVPEVVPTPANDPGDLDLAEA